MEPPKGTPPMDSTSLDAAPVPVEAVLRPDSDAPDVARAQTGDLEGLDTQEAAAALGLNVATLKTRLLRGRLMLREALAPYFGKKRRTAGGAGDGGL